LHPTGLREQVTRKRKNSQKHGDHLASAEVEELVAQLLHSLLNLTVPDKRSHWHLKALNPQNLSHMSQRRGYSQRRIAQLRRLQPHVSPVRQVLLMLITWSSCWSEQTPKTGVLRGKSLLTRRGASSLLASVRRRQLVSGMLPSKRRVGLRCGLATSCSALTGPQISLPSNQPLVRQLL